MTDDRQATGSFKLSRESLKEISLSTVTVVYILISVFWLIPECELRQRVVEPVRGVLLFWGLNQNWKLFSPAIRNINYHTVAIVTHKDGFKQIWEAPRMERLDPISRFTREKFRKWDVDSLPWPAHKQFWPYLARYVGRQLYDRANPPVEFSLCLLWAYIPKPTGGTFIKRNQLPPHTRFNHIFTYRYKSEDFR